MDSEVEVYKKLLTKIVDKLEDFQSFIKGPENVPTTVCDFLVNQILNMIEKKTTPNENPEPPACSVRVKLEPDSPRREIEPVRKELPPHTSTHTQTQSVQVGPPATLPENPRREIDPVRKDLPQSQSTHTQSVEFGPPPILQKMSVSTNDKRECEDSLQQQQQKRRKIQPHVQNSNNTIVKEQNQQQQQQHRQLRQHAKDETFPLTPIYRRL